MMLTKKEIKLIGVGAWRSLVAYLNGVQRAGGSNPLAPTNFKKPPKGRFFNNLRKLSPITDVDNWGGNAYKG